MEKTAKKALRGAIRKQKGFTLIEILIVVILLGVVGGIIALIYSNAGASSARAQAIESFTERATDMIRLTNVQLGTPNNANDDNPLVNTDNTFLDVLVEGDVAVDAAYKTAFARSGVGSIRRALTVDTVATAGTAGEYSVTGYEVTLNADDQAIGTAEFVFTDVPTDVVEILVEKIDPGTAFSATTADTTGPVQYTVAAGGTHTTTLVLPIN